MVGPSKHTHARVQRSHASVGLAQARPNNDRLNINMRNLYAVCIYLKPLPGGGGAWSAATSYPSLPYANSKKTNFLELDPYWHWVPGHLASKYKAGIV